MAAAAPRISVVIPTRHRRDPLARTLAALEAQTLGAQDFEVVVVADPSDDLGAVEAIVDAPRRRMRLHLVAGVTDNASASRNAGWQRAAAPLVAFLGDDIVATPQLLELHLARHDRDGGPRTGVLGLVRWASRLRVTTFMRWLDRGVQFDFASLEGRDTADWWQLYTANVSIPRAALERVGGFDAERYPFLYEDLDLGRRLNLDGGLRLLYEPRAVGEHLHAPTVEEYRGRMAAVARAERRWIEDGADHIPYFHDRFLAAAQQPPAPAPSRLARWVRPETPVIGPRAWAGVDVFYRQQLAPAFLEAWDQAAPKAAAR